jgi:regulatory protein
MMTKPQKTAWVKAMDFLARRDHSEKELTEKLLKHFELSEIEPVLEEMKERGWLPQPEELAQKVTENLHMKKKGHLYIQNFLRQKGLPETPKDMDRELEKARNLVHSKSQDLSNTKKTASLLKNRGFDTETIARVIHEIRQNTPSLY